MGCVIVTEKLLFFLFYIIWQPFPCGTGSLACLVNPGFAEFGFTFFFKLVLKA